MKYGSLWMQVGVEKHKQVKGLLVEELGLVPPSSGFDIPFREEDRYNPKILNRDFKLVFEFNGKGIYRVDFFESDFVWFRYWESNVNPEISETDPMLEAIRRVYDVFNPLRCNYGAFLPEKGIPHRRDIVGRP